MCLRFLKMRIWTNTHTHTHTERERERDKVIIKDYVFTLIYKVQNHIQSNNAVYQIT